MGRMSCLYSMTPFLTDRSLFLFRRGSSIPILWAALILTWSMWGDQVSTVSRVTPQIMSCLDPLDWFPEECYWSGLDEVPSSTCENLRGALEDINGESPFTQPQLKIEVWPRWLTSSVGMQDMAMMAVSSAWRANSMWCEGVGMLLTYRLKRAGEIHPELTKPTCPNEKTWPSGRMSWTSDPWCRMRLYGLCKTGSLGALACGGCPRSRWYQRLWPRWGKLRKSASFSQVPGYSFNEAGQLQWRAMPGSEPKLLVIRQTTLAYM